MTTDAITILLATISAWLLLLAAFWFIGLVSHLFWTALTLGWNTQL